MTSLKKKQNDILNSSETIFLINLVTGKEAECDVCMCVSVVSQQQSEHPVCCFAICWKCF